MKIPLSQPPVLCFSASDPTSGAGIQADLLAIVAQRTHPLSVITALTVQDTTGVIAIAPTPPDLLTAQANAVLADCPVAAFKIGVLGSADNAEAVADLIAQYPGIPLVLDPVLASGRGDPFADDALLDVLRTRLLPLAALITPNWPEACRLADLPAATPPETLAQSLLERGTQHVLLTGGDVEVDMPQVTNRLYGPAGLIFKLHFKRLPGSFHGSGCTLAAAIAAQLARGKKMTAAVRHGLHYTARTLAHAFPLGRGQAIPDRLYRLPN